MGNRSKFAGVAVARSGEASFTLSMSSPDHAPLDEDEQWKMLLCFPSGLDAWRRFRWRGIDSREAELSEQARDWAPCRRQGPLKNQGKTTPFRWDPDADLGSRSAPIHIQRCPSIGQPGHLGAELVGDAAPLGVGGGNIGLGESGPYAFGF
jgi:hypothetical protein